MRTQRYGNGVWRACLWGAGAWCVVVGMGDAHAQTCAEGLWETLAPIPVAVQEVGVAEVGGYVYVVGGFNAAGQSVNTVWRYDAGANAWQSVPDLPAPAPLNHVAAAGVDGRLYVIGGLRQNFTGVDTVYMYDPLVHQWTTRAPMPTARGAMGVAVIDGKIYAAGGFPGARANDFAVYDPVANSWTTLPNMPTGRDHLAAAAVRGKFYAISGRRVGVLGQVEEFDPVLGEWRGRASIPTPRGGIAGAVVHDRVYVFGGEGNPNNALGIFDDVEEYDPAHDRWRVLAPMPLARHGIGAAVVGGRIHVPAGGPRQGFSTTTHHDVFAPPEVCYADCDVGTGWCVLDIFDFLCFGNLFGAGAAYACDCDTSTGVGVCDVFDFLCFGNAFARGCE